MNELELKRIRDSDKAITDIAVEAKKVHKSYGQLQAERYEKQLREGLITTKSNDDQYEYEEESQKKHGGRPKKEKPYGWEAIARMVVNREMGKYSAAAMLHVAPQTLTKWIEELVSEQNGAG